MLNINQLSQEVGIGVDTLRVWERRYNFPDPGVIDVGGANIHRSRWTNCAWLSSYNWMDIAREPSSS